MPTWYHRDSYNENMERDELCDNPPKFKVGDRVIILSSAPGVEGYVRGVLDPRLYVGFVGLQTYDKLVDTWSIYLDIAKGLVSLDYIYTIKFSDRTLVSRLDPTVPERIKEANKVWTCTTCESDLELSGEYWGRMEAGL